MATSKQYLQHTNEVIRKPHWPNASRPNKRQGYTLPSSARDTSTDRSTLSVVLPNYNHGRLIGRAIEAILGQKRLPDEIIIVDDASTDDSLTLIRPLAAKSSRIFILALPVNVGTIAANRKALELTKGKYIYFAAADDWVLPGFFELGIRCLLYTSRCV